MEYQNAARVCDQMDNVVSYYGRDFGKSGLGCDGWG